jgi:hypothetical protein
MFSAVSLLIAIPSSIITRLITHSGYPKIDVNPSNVANLLGLDGASSPASHAHSTAAASVTNHSSLATGFPKSEMKSVLAESSTSSKSTTDETPDSTGQIPPIDAASAGGMMGLAVLEVAVAIKDTFDQNKYQSQRPPLTFNSRLGKILTNTVKIFVSSSVFLKAYSDGPVTSQAPPASLTHVLKYLRDTSSLCPTTARYQAMIYASRWGVLRRQGRGLTS